LFAGQVTEFLQRELLRARDLLDVFLVVLEELECHVKARVDLIHHWGHLQHLEIRLFEEVRES